MLQALIGLFELPEDDSIPDDEHFIEIEDTPGTFSCSNSVQDHHQLNIIHSNCTLERLSHNCFFFLKSILFVFSYCCFLNQAIRQLIHSWHLRARKKGTHFLEQYLMLKFTLHSHCRSCPHLSPGRLDPLS